jgi:hypothetical protein
MNQILQEDLVSACGRDAARQFGTVLEIDATGLTAAVLWPTLERVEWTETAGLRHEVVEGP